MRVARLRAYQQADEMGVLEGIPARQRAQVRTHKRG